MSNRPILKHLDELRAVSGGLDNNCLGALALACCERQFPVYEKAAKGQDWGQIEDLYSCIEEGWRWLKASNRVPLSLTYSQLAESLAPEPVDAASSAASDICFAVSALMRFFIEGRSALAIGVCETSVNLLDALIYSLTELAVNSQNDLIIDQHELMVTELDRQRDDLNVVQTILFSEKEIAAFRQRHRGVSLFESYWYPDDY